MRLADRVAVVTGSGRPDGLGAAILARLAADGAAVVVSDLASETDVEAVAKTLREGGARVIVSHAT